MATLADRIKAAEQKLTKMREQKRAADALQEARNRKKERSDETRRKILAGAAALAEPGLNDLVLEALTRRLTRADDRALFNLPAAPPRPAQGDKSNGY
ncbi:MAG: hypothetical protein H6Q76_1734 [Firmicutes bacterium]|nr:hypothetical protein [Bacillota bacterium]